MAIFTAGRVRKWYIWCALLAAICSIAYQMLICFATFSLLWRIDRRDGVSNHQPHDCLLNRSVRRRSRKTLKLRVTGLLRGIHRWPVNSSHKCLVTRKMFRWCHIFFSTGHIVSCDWFTRNLPCCLINAGLTVELTLLIRVHSLCLKLFRLTHRGRNKIAAISQRTFSDAFSWMKMYKCCLSFQWN